MKPLHRNLGRLAIALICLLICPQPSWARNARERFIVVDASDLAEFPHRYWGRGVVFEDTFQSFIGRSEQVGGRRFSGISTRQMGRIFISPDLASTVERMQPDRTYLFAGVVVGESRRRIPFLGARTRYWVAVEEIEALVDADDDDLIDLLLGGDGEHIALAPILQAVRSAQNQLIAHATSQGVPIESLFDPNAPRQDVAIQAARNAVRDLSNQTGITAAEYLSILVRELLALEYDLAVPTTDPAENSISSPPTLDLPTDSDPVYNAPAFDEAQDDFGVEFVPEP